MMFRKNIILLLLTLFMSGEVFSQKNNSIFAKKKTKERTSQSTSNKVDRKKIDKNKVNKNKKYISNKARLDTKDGSIFIGEYIEENVNNITLKLLTDDIITFDKEQIRKARTPLNSIVLNKGRFHRTEGLFLHYNVGFNGGESGAGFMGDIGLGYRLGHRIDLQAGIGFMGTSVSNPFLQWNTPYRTFYPLYAGARYNFTHGSCRIFATGKAGYSNVLNPDGGGWGWRGDIFEVSGGAYFEPGVGVAFAGKRAGRTEISLTQIFQYSDISFESRDDFNNLISGHGNMWIRRIGLRFTTTIN